MNKQEYITDYWKSQSLDYLSSGDKNIFNHCHANRKNRAEISILDGYGFKNKVGDRKLLDLGCGTGRLIAHYYPYFNRVVGTEISPELVDKLYKKYTGNPERKHIHFMALDILDNEFRKKINMQFTHILLFGVTQIILADGALFQALLNIERLLHPDGTLYLKQTTSKADEGIKIDEYSKELKTHWVANYRTAQEIETLCDMAQLKVVESFNAYNKENLKQDFKRVEKWEDTRQMIFIIKRK